MTNIEKILDDCQLGHLTNLPVGGGSYVFYFFGNRIFEDSKFGKANLELLSELAQTINYLLI